MTEPEITALGPAFAAYLRHFRRYLGQERTAKHFGTYCRGLLSDLPRKSIEPIALEAGTAVRTLQEFLVTARWDHAAARDTLQKHAGAVVAGLPTLLPLSIFENSRTRRRDCGWLRHVMMHAR